MTNDRHISAFKVRLTYLGAPLNLHAKAEYLQDRENSEKIMISKMGSERNEGSTFVKKIENRDDRV